MGIGYFTRPSGRARFMSAYEHAMRLLPEPRNIHDVETEFGCVRVYQFGVSHGSPIVLLHGRSGSTPTWEPNIGALSARHPVYSVDLLGEPGHSVQLVPIRNAEDQACWLDATLGGLELERVHLVGASIGGWLAFNQALRTPHRIGSVSLLDPANVLARFSGRILLGAAGATMPFVSRWVRPWFLNWIAGGIPVAKDDPVAHLIALGMQEYTSVLPAPPYPGDQQLRSIGVPVLALLAGRSVVHNAEHARQRAQTLIPRVEAELWPIASHAISGECAEQVNARILQFIDRLEIPAYGTSH